MSNHRAPLVYLIGNDAVEDTIQYLVNLVAHSAALPFHIIIVEQSGILHPAILTLTQQSPHIEAITLDIPPQTRALLRLRILIAWLIHTKPAIVHLLAATPDTDTEVIAALWVAQVPTRIVTLAEVAPTVRSDGLRPIYSFFAQRLLRTLSDIIVYTSAAKQILQHEYRLTDTHIAVIPIGIDAAVYALHMTPDHDRASYNLPAEGQLIASIGQLAPHKGHSVLIHAMDSIWQYIPDVSLVIVGTGEHRAYLHTLAGQSTHPERIVFIDDIADRTGFLRCIDVYVQPSFSEPMSFDLLMAMAMERPVVASAIANIHEIIESNASGLLVRPGSADALASAIMRIFNDAAIRITVSLNARTRVAQRFTMERWLTATVALYRRV